MKAKRRISGGCLALVMLLSAALATGQQGPDPEAAEAGAREAAEAAPVTRDEPRISRRDAALLVEEHYAGRLLSVRLEDGYWRVRLDDAGRVYNVFVDAATGELRESLD